jgi:hypothetical protein
MRFLGQKRRKKKTTEMRPNLLWVGLATESRKNASDKQGKTSSKVYGEFFREQLSVCTSGVMGADLKGLSTSCSWLRKLYLDLISGRDCSF